MLDRLKEEPSKASVEVPNDSTNASNNSAQAPNNADVKLTIKSEEINKENATADFYVYALNEKGEKVWNKSWRGLMLTELPTASEFAIFNDVVIIEVYGDLYGMDYFSGKDLWKVEGVGSGKPFIDTSDGTIYICGYYGPLISAVSSNGTLKWRKNDPADDIFWPYKVDIKGNQVIVTAEQAQCVYDKSGNLLEIKPLSGSEAANSEYAPPAPAAANNSSGVDVIDVTASSFLAEKTISHRVENICDNNSTTAWVEDVQGDGIGEYVHINFSFDGTETIRKIRLINSYAKSEDTYSKNNRVRKVELSFS